MEVTSHGPLSDLNPDSFASPEQALVLDDSTKPNAPTIDWYKFLPVSIVSAMYGVHRYYRRHRPRTLPTLTSMRPLELYIPLALAYMLTYESVEREMEVIEDRDLLVIELAARRARDVLMDPEIRGKFGNFDKKLLSDEHKEALRRIREARYEGAGLGGKLAWWHNHLWSNEETWNEWATLIGLHVPFNKWPDKTEDWDTVVTHISNTSTDARLDTAAALAFVYTVPVAMLARWTRRPLLFRPVNGVQRLLLGAWIYCTVIREHQRWAYLRQIRDKQQWAEVLPEMFGDFEEEIEYAQEEGEIP
ncbi:hypothetical protein C8Q80DRAFT_1135144 [Daedaleopsis nitida]|nr:hypothetical protein C8Q80DRAFT_1135144 [Daedaleopsis nitida]